MTFKIFKVIGTVFETIVGIFLMILGTMLSMSAVENMIIQEEMKEFIDNSTYEKTIGRFELYVNYTDEEVDDTIYFDKDGFPQLGNTGDFFIMPQSRMKVLPYSEEFIGFLFGGHAGILKRNEGRLSGSVEAMGGTEEEAFVLAYKDSGLWEFYDENPRTVMGMRVKTDEDTRIKAYNYARSLSGKAYSYNYLVHKKDAYYCTDLVSRVYGAEGGFNFNLDENGFYTSTQDLFLSKDRMISFIKVQKGSNTCIYYLKTRGK